MVPSGSPGLKKLQQEPHSVKVMLIIAHDITGVILHHMVSKGCTMNAEYY
jgi:hypothetical protein